MLSTLIDLNMLGKVDDKLDRFDSFDKNRLDTKLSNYLQANDLSNMTSNKCHSCMTCMEIGKLSKTEILHQYNMTKAKNNQNEICTNSNKDSSQLCIEYIDLMKNILNMR